MFLSAPEGDHPEAPKPSEFVRVAGILDFCKFFCIEIFWLNLSVAPEASLLFPHLSRKTKAREISTHLNHLVEFLIQRSENLHL